MDNTIKYANFEGFMVSPKGRWGRILGGLAIIGTGLFLKKPNGYIVASVGLIPLLAGSLDYCLLGPVLGGPFRGDEMRRQLANQDHRTLHA